MIVAVGGRLLVDAKTTKLAGLAIKPGKPTRVAEQMARGICPERARVAAAVLVRCCMELIMGVAIEV